MRRLPVFILLDVSESMAGASHEAVTQAIGTMVEQLRRDPEALEKLYLSILVFAGKPKTIVPLTELSRFYQPEMPLGSGTALGAALDHLMTEIDKTVVRPSETSKGDWKPIVFLLTDGAPTDNPAAAIARWTSDYAGRIQMVAVSVGPAADVSVLKSMTPDVIRLANADPSSLAKFVDWMSQSVRVHSQRIGDGPAQSGITLDKGLPKGAEAVTDAAGIAVDERVATFVGRCQQTEAPYLARFEREAAGQPYYVLRQVTSLRESFFDLSDEAGLSAGTLNTNQIAGMPGCPHCGSRIGLVWCGACGKVHCIQGPGAAICPWCGYSGNYGPAPDGVNWDVGRSAG